jgi:hypothetical protein
MARHGGENNFRHVAERGGKIFLCSENSPGEIKSPCRKYATAEKIALAVKSGRTK